MNFDDFITCLGWTAFTYSVIRINVTFAAAVRQEIQNYNNGIRKKVFQELNSPRTNLKP